MAVPPEKLGTPGGSGPRTWVQTERAAHEAWGNLTMKSPRAAALMHQLVANMGHQNAVVVSQKTLAKLMRCSERTIRNALTDLVKDRWVQVVQIGAAGTINAYVVNSAVAWGEKREHLRLSVFHAAVVADAADQPEGAIDRTDLRRVPIIIPPEQALLAGEGEPGAQIALPGMEPVIEGQGGAPVFRSELAAPESLAALAAQIAALKFDWPLPPDAQQIVMARNDTGSSDMLEVVREEVRRLLEEEARKRETPTLL